MKQIHILERILFRFLFLNSTFFLKKSVLIGESVSSVFPLYRHFPDIHNRKWFWDTMGERMGRIGQIRTDFF
jgi:hypothetical protein